ncbi:hypothetical protein Adt_03229 [Abeliophyllum distichum]|uniref:Uncharacterized protein n=1 Tax=Abeliophyllum distichum TaxID=126358 RepID=A0ABD1VXX5_9LAMI
MRAESRWERHWREPSPSGRGIGGSRVPVGEALEEAESQWERHWRKPSPSGRGIGGTVGEALEEAESRWERHWKEPRHWRNSGRGIGGSRVPVGEALERAESQLKSLGSPLNDCTCWFDIGKDAACLLGYGDKVVAVNHY